ncbi:hypothetical protein EI94DRAFT_1740730 [Lactarius quietus]|nr:hypothetical protein EI94DRAFT_1740730 [Lactarius quietus]
MMNYRHCKERSKRWFTRPSGTRCHPLEEIYSPFLILYSSQALQSLSSREPSIQLPRLKLLIDDLHTTLLPLFPAEHPVLISLSAPLPPTSSPLLTAVNYSREILRRYIDTLLASLTAPPTELLELATLVTETIRSLLTLAETMRDDLSQFVLGSMGEAQLSVTIADQAREQQRALVLDMWRESVIQEHTVTWLADLSQPYTLIVAPTSRKWVLRLVQALGATDPVTCSLPTKPFTPGESAPPPVPNTLPPPFFFSTPELFYIQDFLQAVVIAAALRALLPASVSPPEDFMYRIWTLLQASVNEENGAEDARLINLADELVRASSLVDDEAAKLRAAVARTVRASDPVFLLLQRRLLSTLAERLARAPTELVHRKDAPAEMRTGRREQSTLKVTSEEAETLDVKGFSDPVLSGANQEGFKKLRTSVRWIESIWADTLERKNIDGHIM